MTDNELVYLQRTEHLERAKNILLEKYMETIKNHTYWTCRNNFFNKPLEIGEIPGIAYISLVKAMNTFNLKQNRYNFLQAARTVTKSFTVREVSEAVGFKNAINHYKRFDMKWADYNKDQMYIEEDKNNQKIQNELHKKDIKKFLETCGPLIKQVIKMRIQDYSIEQISKQLKITSKKITNITSYFIKKCREYYEIQ